MTRNRAFTLIEILVVVSIIALIVGITMPSLAEAQRTSKKAKCKHNLRQIGEAVSAYMLNHRDTFPYIARLPSYERALAKGEGRKPYPSMQDAFKREIGGMNEVFECPADQKNDMNIMPDAPPSFFKRDGTSYEWNALINGLHLGFRGVRIPLYEDIEGAVEERLEGDTKGHSKLRPEELEIIYDFEAFHSAASEMRSRNWLYADLHVENILEMQRVEDD